MVMKKRVATVMGVLLMFIAVMSFAIGFYRFLKYAFEDASFGFYGILGFIIFGLSLFILFSVKSIRRALE